MLFEFLKTAWYFKISYLLALFGLNKKYKRLYYCGQSFNKVSYRLPKSSQSDLFIAIRIYKRIFLGFLNTKKPYTLNNTNVNKEEAIFDGSLNSIELRQTYLETLTGKQCILLVSKNDLLFYNSLIHKIGISFFLSISFLPVFIISMLANKKSNLPLIMMELIECFNLLLILKSHKIKKLHYFCIYERDANLCAYILMKNKIFVNKIPSEVPLGFLNKIIVADQLSFCFAYQQEEYNAFKDTMFISKTELWVPETAYKAPKRFFEVNRTIENAKYDIGFFSSASWVRDLSGDAELGGRDKENEGLLLQHLINYSKLKKLSLCVFLHPLEKRIENKELVEEYYFEIFKNNHVYLADTTQPSIEGFDGVNLCVALYSTLLFESVFFAFKTLIAPWGYEEVFFKTSVFANIVAYDCDELSEKLDKYLPLKKDDFFKTTNLLAYTLNNQRLDLYKFK